MGMPGRGNEQKEESRGGGGGKVEFAEEVMNEGGRDGKEKGGSMEII